MKTYLSYKTSLKIFEDVLETTKAIEKISASYIHFLRQKVYDLNLYSQHLEEVLGRILLFLEKEKEKEPFLREGKGEKAVLIIGGDRGLVGGLWHQILNAFLEKEKEYKSIIVVGKMIKEFLKEERKEIKKWFFGFSSLEGLEIETEKSKELLLEISNYIFDQFKQGEYKKIDILYPSFISLSEQEPLFVSFLPFEFGEKLKNKNEEKEDLGFPIFEPSKIEIFHRLLKKYIKISLYKIILEAKLSEFSARTVTMEQASEKTKELISHLDLSFKKERRRISSQRQIESFSVRKI